MEARRAISAGGSTFVLNIPKGMLKEEELEPYETFSADFPGEEETLFILTLVEYAAEIAEEGPLTADLEDENGRMTVRAQDTGGLMIRLTIAGEECCRLTIAEDYRKAKAWIGGRAGERRYALDTALMLLYTFASSKRDTLLLHASVVEYAGKGYLFLGKSGTGKSTHSRLWTEHIEGAELLNDDNPIVRIEAGRAWVYGSPWSGKTRCYRNRRIPVGGIVRLQQGAHNEITPLTGIKAYAAILPSCSCMKWDSEMAGAVHATLCRLVENVGAYHLECLADRESAELCHKTLTENE